MKFKIIIFRVDLSNYRKEIELFRDILICQSINKLRQIKMLNFISHKLPVSNPPTIAIVKVDAIPMS